MISLTELKAMLKKNKIRGYLHYNKSEPIDVLNKRGLLPETTNVITITSLPQPENIKKEIYPKYNFLYHIRNSPKKVEIRDIETDEIIVYSSMYKAAKKFNQQSRLISTYDGKVYRNKYAIKVLTEYDYIFSIRVHIHIRIKISNKSQTFCYRETGMITSCLK